MIGHLTWYHVGHVKKISLTIVFRSYRHFLIAVVNFFVDKQLSYLRGKYLYASWPNLFLCFWVECNGIFLELVWLFNWTIPKNFLSLVHFTSYNHTLFILKRVSFEIYPTTLWNYYNFWDLERCIIVCNISTF